MAKDNLPVRPEGAWAAISTAADPAERFKLAKWAVEPTEVPGFKYPVPPFFFDLPWGDDDDATVTSILASIAASEDITDATQGSELRDPYDLIGEPVTILGAVARASDVQDARWGAYLSLTVSVAGGEPEVVNTGAGQVCVTVWRLWCEGKLPCTGEFMKMGAEQKGRKQPLGFRIHEAF